MYLSICLSIYLSVYLSVRPSVRPFVHPSAQTVFLRSVLILSTHLLCLLCACFPRGFPKISPPLLFELHDHCSSQCLRFDYPSSTKQVVKVKLSLCFNWAPYHEGVLGEWRYSSTHSLTSALDGGEWSASRPGRFTPREKAHGTHWIGGWVGPRAILDTVVKRKIPSPRRESNPRTQIVQPVAKQAVCPLKFLVMLADNKGNYRQVVGSTLAFSENSE
jgi:hypothetical protein